MVMRLSREIFRHSEGSSETTLLIVLLSFGKVYAKALLRLMKDKHVKLNSSSFASPLSICVSFGSIKFRKHLRKFVEEEEMTLFHDRSREAWSP
ncbi:hypothetical protein LINPERPRIM_LOCUS38797, partial [Linum perenne]